MYSICSLYIRTSLLSAVKCVAEILQVDASMIV